MDKVSIITPAYNAELNISQAINSVLSQRYDDWELIVVDDGSTDETANVVEGFLSIDSRIRLIRQENGGPASARRTGVSTAEGRFLAFLDSDDYWLEDKLKTQLDFMKIENAAFTFTRFRRINADGSRVGHLVRIPNRLRYCDLLKNTAIATSTVVLDCSLVSSIEIKDTYYDDYALWLSLLKKGIVAQGVQSDLMRYRVLERSVSRNKLNSSHKVWKTYREVENLNIIYSGYCFTHYAFAALKKYLKF